MTFKKITATEVTYELEQSEVVDQFDAGEFLITHILRYKDGTEPVKCLIINGCEANVIIDLNDLN